MKWLVTAVLLFVLPAFAAAGGEQPQLDRSKEFTYVLPDGWKTIPELKTKHDVFLIPADDGKQRNLVVNDQPGKSPLPALKAKYEVDLAKALKDFKLVSSDLVKWDDREAIRIIHTNSAPGIPVRQVNYIVEIGAKRYFVAATTLAEDDDKYDAAVEEFAKSIAAPAE